MNNTITKLNRFDIDRKIEKLIEETEAEREAAQPGYVTPAAAKDIDKSGIEKIDTDDIQAPDLSDAGQAASLLNKVGKAAAEHITDNN